MVKLVKNQSNRIAISVTSLIDYSGFSASLEVGGITKTIPSLKSANAKVEFSASDIGGMTDFATGYLTVLDGDGKTYVRMMPMFKLVENPAEAVGFQTITVVIVPLFRYEGGGGGGDVPKDVVRKSDFAGIDKAKASVNSCQTAVNSILDAVAE